MNPHDGEPSTAGGPATDRTAGAPVTSDPTGTDMSTDEPGSGEAADPLDLDRIGRDLDGVEAALRRLDDGTYWTDEVTGGALPDELLDADPVARRVEG